MITTLTQLVASTMFTVLVASSGADKHMLYPDPCASPDVMTQVHESRLEDWHASRSLVSGIRYETCWSNYKEGRILVLYPDGDTSEQPTEVFVQKARPLL